MIKLVFNILLFIDDHELEIPILILTYTVIMYLLVTGVVFRFIDWLII